MVSIVKNTQRFTTRISEMYIDDGIFYIMLKDDLSVEEADVIEMVEPARKLCGQAKFPIVVHTGKNSWFSPRCRRYYAREFSTFRTMEAIICETFYHRLAAQLYISVDKPSTPAKIFKTLASAEAWLRKNTH